MTNKNSRSQSNSVSRKADDFRLIHGLTKTAKAKLHAAGILTFDQLAAMSPHEIVAAIEDADSASAETSAERIIREDWIGQAKKLAESLKAATASPAESLATASAEKAKERVTSFVLELKLSQDNAVTQTRVMHVESVEKDAEKKWAGWNEAELLSFIAHRAGFALPAKPKEPDFPVQAEFAVASIEERLRRLHTKTEPSTAKAIPPPPEAQPEATTNPKAATKSELAVFAGGINLPSGLVPSGTPYSLKVLLDPAVIQSAEAAEMTYTVTVYAKPLADSAGRNASAVIGQSQGTVKLADNLIFDVEGAKLAQGAYRLQATASFQSPATKKVARKHFSTLVEGGLLQVY